MSKEEKVIAQLTGFEKDPGITLVIQVNIDYVPVSVIQAAFKEKLGGGELHLGKEHEEAIYKTTDIKIDTDKLDFFLGLVRA